MHNEGYIWMQNNTKYITRQNDYQNSYIHKMSKQIVQQRNKHDHFEKYWYPQQRHSGVSNFQKLMDDTNNFKFQQFV